MDLLVDPDQYTDQDLGTTLLLAGAFFSGLLGENIPEGKISEHLLAAQAGLRDAISALALPTMPEVAGVSGDAGNRVASLDGLGMMLWKHLGSGPYRAEARVAAAQAVHTLMTELHRAGRTVVGAGLGPEPAAGRITHLARGKGGVPKEGATSVDINAAGVVGDRQATRRHHGRPWQALCIWSAELIAEHAAAGHPIYPGAAGENITLSGFDWADIRPGVQLRIGTDVVCEISSYATPCDQNARWFSDRDFRRIDESRGPVSRMYASVLAPGIVRLDDTVQLIP